jgi:hypothetical protein
MMVVVDQVDQCSVALRTEWVVILAVVEVEEV